MNPVSPNFGSVSFYKSPGTSYIEKIEINPDEEQGKWFYYGPRGRILFREDSGDRSIEGGFADQPNGDLTPEKRRHFASLLKQQTTTRALYFLSQYRGILVRPLMHGIVDGTVPVEVVRKPLDQSG